MPCRVCLGPMQESAFRRHVQQHLSFVETVLGPLPDWRSTAFWRDSSFTQAWQKGKELFLPLLPQYEEAVAELTQEEMCVLFPVWIYTPCLLDLCELIAQTHDRTYPNVDLMMFADCSTGTTSQIQDQRCLCLLSQRMQLPSSWQRARCSWQGKQACAATPSAPPVAKK